ncbi:unnamed protein product [Sphagnum compactum]
MAKDSLFGGLPPPVSPQPNSTTTSAASRAESKPPIPSTSAAPITKRAGDAKPKEGKRVRFQPTTIEASSEQVVEAMAKIAIHIGNPGKFSKASKLALQLLQAGSVNLDTADPFFRILKAAMVCPSHATDAALRSDYQALFNAVHEKLECFSGAQRMQIEVWELWVLVANDLYTDDTFVFSKASSRVRQVIDSLPEATEEENLLETRDTIEGPTLPEESLSDSRGNVELQCTTSNTQEESDPFGLNALLPKVSKKEERARRKLEEEATSKKAQEEARGLLREQREAVLNCLKLAADHYKVQWAQTIIDILVKHAYDNALKFTSVQRNAIENLWTSVREQQMRRKQGKSSSSKLDVTSFERLQHQYSRETISIRRAVGSSGERSAEQWLG